LKERKRVSEKERSKKEKEYRKEKLMANFSDSHILFIIINKNRESCQGRYPEVNQRIK